MTDVVLRRSRDPFAFHEPTPFDSFSFFFDKALETVDNDAGESILQINGVYSLGLSLCPFDIDSSGFGDSDSGPFTLFSGRVYYCKEQKNGDERNACTNSVSIRMLDDKLFVGNGSEGQLEVEIWLEHTEKKFPTVRYKFLRSEDFPASDDDGLFDVGTEEPKSRKDLNSIVRRLLIRSICFTSIAIFPEEKLRPHLWRMVDEIWKDGKIDNMSLLFDLAISGSSAEHGTIRMQTALLRLHKDKKLHYVNAMRTAINKATALAYKQGFDAGKEAQKERARKAFREAFGDMRVE